MAMLKFGEKAPLENVLEEDLPLPRTEYRKAYLTTDGLSMDQPASTAGTVSYNSEDPEDAAKFRYTFTERTRLFGIPKAVLYMHCDDLNYMDVFLILTKISASGEMLLALNIPWKNLPVSSLLPRSRKIFEPR
ncbi:uncharacterized protein N7477_009080 [Penicillium maclennaniae]|uniref:uncharacterized protein n=1 Tax=Penicillium maclennaniae TaxID=1343394 RepID=UPI0025424592|nr:uncharacterized protein N7477_009080 [Penicillium maclennaniae]KAJ5661464.1 hypothetical protein N7477_009080 [Penicillium maclennaniae]